VQQPGGTFTAGARPVKFKKSGSFLFCLLPSGRVLTYPYPEVKDVETPWGAMKPQLSYMGTDALTKAWTRIETYGGKLVENIIQAICRDLLAEAIVRLETAGYFVVMHVHDEIVCEVKDTFGSLGEMEKLMSFKSQWATGMPVAVEGWRGKRYRK